MRSGPRDDRGRKATTPGDITTRGWREILLRVNGSLNEDSISIVAAGVAYYALSAIFPALGAAVSIYGLVADPVVVGERLNVLRGIVPGEALALIETQLQSIARSSSQALSVGVIGGLFLALWSASAGIKAMIAAMNIAYNEREKRRFLRLNGLALLLTVGAIVFALMALALVVALPVLLNRLVLGSIPRELVAWLRWPLLAVAVMFGLTVLYRYGPSREHVKWRWVSWGSFVATLLWLPGSALFSYYVSNFGNYNTTYGSVGAVIILLLWLYLTSYVVLLGAELNSEIERRTRIDTTAGGPQAPGRHGYAADAGGKRL